jgi:hypothetical protein
VLDLYVSLSATGTAVVMAVVEEIEVWMGLYLFLRSVCVETERTESYGASWTMV